MLKSVRFRNFKVLRNTMLPLERFTLMVGPNGSGKSTALQALNIARSVSNIGFYDVLTAGLSITEAVNVFLDWDAPYQGVTKLSWDRGGSGGIEHRIHGDKQISKADVLNKISRIRLYSLEAKKIAESVPLNPNIEVGQDGSMLAGVLDQLRDREPERFELLNQELGRWLPEFDRILFETPSQGYRRFLLRTREGSHKIRAPDLSQGTLIALAILTIAYISDPPPMVCIEEPDRGIHPRLLREVRDALYRLSYPESFGENREPVQVVATTHSPYFLDLFKDHPEEIVICEKVGLEARFDRLSDRKDLLEILEGVHLGDAWYSGILGGVPSGQ